MKLKELAELAGVSVGTASKAFSGSKEISPETREKIFSLAKKNGCFDKYNKKKFSKKVIAVICPEIKSDYYDTILTILDREISKRNSIMVSSIYNFNEQAKQELFTYYSSYCNVDGIIIIGSSENLCNEMLIPSVALGSTHKNNNIDSIKTDLLPSIEKAIFYLKENGHKDISFISEGLTYSKLEMFKKAMRKAGLPVQNKFIKTSSERFEQAGTVATKELLSQEKLPTAIFTAYDYIAIGVIKQLKKHGIRVPEDISVIGIDNIDVGHYLETALSSISTHTEEACKTAVDIIIKKTENKYYRTNHNITVDTEFIIRESSGKAPEKPISV